MKMDVLGIAIASVTLMAAAGQSAWAQEDTPTVVIPPSVIQPDNAATGGPAPASVQELKDKIDAINNSRSATGVDEVVKLFQAGVDKGVIETYIRNSRIPAPTPKDLIYLHGQGIPEDLVKALIDHGREMRQADATAAAPQNSQADNAMPIAPYGPTYNNYVYAPGAAATAPSYSSDDSASSSSVTVIPYNPYRNYYQSYYSAPFYSGWGSPYYGSPSSWYWSGYYNYCWPSYGYGYSFPYRNTFYSGFGPNYYGGLRGFGPNYYGGNRSGLAFRARR